MEEQTTIIVLSKEQLLVFTAAIILAGICSNYSTLGPSTSHILVAKGAAKELIDRIQKEQR